MPSSPPGAESSDHRRHQYLVDHGYRVHPTSVVVDRHRGAGRHAQANDLVLTRSTTASGLCRPRFLGQRQVTIERAPRLNSRIRDRLSSADTRIVNSYVGPFTSIYHHVVVEDAEIEHSIVLEAASRPVPHRGQSHRRNSGSPLPIKPRRSR